MNDFLASLKNVNVEQYAKILSTPEGRRVFSEIMRDGSSIKRAAEKARDGDSSELRGIIESMAKTPDGAAVVSQILNLKNE